MTKTAHTPGPWLVSESNDRDLPSVDAKVPTGGIVEICMAWGNQYYQDRDPTAEANAARIVACVNACEGIANPDVVPEAIEALWWAIDTLQEINPSNYDHDDVCDLNAASVEVALGLQAILAKLEGRS